MHGCEIWTIKKAEHQRTDAFELWCWRRLLRIPWTTRRLNQSILKEISPEYSLEGLMLKLKLQYLATWCKELVHWKRPWCWENWRQEEKRTEDEMVGWHHQLYGHECEQAPGVVDGQGILAAVHGVSKSWTQLINWTELTWEVHLSVSYLFSFSYSVKIMASQKDMTTYGCGATKALIYLCVCK